MSEKCNYCKRICSEGELQLFGKCCLDCAHDKRKGNHKPIVFYHPQPQESK